MKFSELDPVFLKAEDGKSWRKFVSFEEANGVRFLCPKCFRANGGPIGTHSIICWSRSRGAPEDIAPLPGRWRMDGTGATDLTLNADPPSGARSVALTSGCAWHGFITNGDVTDA